MSGHEDENASHQCPACRWSELHDDDDIGELCRRIFIVVVVGVFIFVLYQGYNSWPEDRPLPIGIVVSYDE